MTATVAAHPWLLVAGVTAVAWILLVVVVKMLVPGGDYNTPGPWTRSTARVTRAARRVSSLARRLPGATRTWFHREMDGLRDYPPGAGDDPDQVIPWLHALRTAPQLHHEYTPAPTRGDAQGRAVRVRAPESRPAARADMTGSLSPHPHKEGPQAASAPPPGGTPDVPGRGTPEPPSQPPVAGGRAAGGANALPAHPAGDPGPPAAPTLTGAAGGHPMPPPTHPEMWTRYNPDPDPWHTQRIPPIQMPAAKDAAALDYMPRAPFALWNSDTFVSGLPAIRDGA